MTGYELFERLQDDVRGEVEMGDLVSVINRKARDISKLWFWRYYQSTYRLDTTADYTTGTVTVTNGSTTVTGSGTTFTSAMAGRKFRVGTRVYDVSAYVGATEITLDRGYEGTTEAGASYTIFQDVYALPDMRRLHSIRDVMSGSKLIQRSFHTAARENWGGSSIHLSDDSYLGTFQWEYAFWEYDTTNNQPYIQLRFSVPDGRALDVEYYAWPTDIDDISGTLDIPTTLEDAVYHAVLEQFMRRLPHATEIELAYRAQRIREAQTDKAAAVALAKKADVQLADANIRLERTVL